MKKLLYLFFPILFPLCMFSQEKVEGVIYDEGSANAKTPLLGANVYWLHTEVGTVTDFDGNFSIPYKEEYKQLIDSLDQNNKETILNILFKIYLRKDI